MICGWVRKTLLFDYELVPRNKIISRYFKKVFVLMIFFLHLSAVFGQEKGEIKIYFETDTVAVLEGTSFINFLVTENIGKQEISIEDITPEEVYPGLLLSPRAEFTLTAGSQRRLPVKFLANIDFMKMKTKALTFTVLYKSLTTTESLSTSFYIQKEEEKNILVYPFSRENYIHPASPESMILLFVENKGYSERNIRLDFQTFPEGLEIVPEQQTLLLESLEKRMIEIKVSNRRPNSLLADYRLLVKVTDQADGENVRSSYIPLTVLTHNRQVEQRSGLINGNNFAEMNHHQNSSGLNYLQMRGNGEFPVLPDLRGRVNLTVDSYHQQGLYNLYDTWLELEKNNSLLRIGNVYGDDYDYSVSGRGGKITAAIRDERELEVIVLENNYNLFGTYYPQVKGSGMAGAKYGFGSSGSVDGRVSYLFDYNPYLSTTTHVSNLVSSYRISDHSHLRWEAGLSHEKGLLLRDRHLGASGGLNYDTRFGKWDFKSLNSYSTRSYAGLGRGSFHFNQRISRTFSHQRRLFFLYHNSQIQPEYLSFQSEDHPGENIYPDYFYSRQEAKIGYHFAIRDWNFLISPTIEKQKNTIHTSTHELLAYRFRLNMMKSFGSHGFNFTSEYSYSGGNSSMNPFSGIKADMSYRYKAFSLNGSMQWNPYNVSDLNSYYYSDQDFVNYNLNANYNFQTANRTLTGFISAGTYYSELYQNLNQNLAGNLEYKISPSWSATGYFNYSQYQSIEADGYRGSHHQFRIGLKKYFRSATAAGNHKVSFVLFADDNFNGKLDAGETVLANEVVKLDDYIAITDQKGRVTFQNVPEGIYELKVNEKAGSRLMVDPQIVVDRNIKKEVGMISNIRITGRLSEVRQDYDVRETNGTGIRVYAKDKEGKIKTTVVDQNNEFEFYLTEGEYEIYIENEVYEFIDPVKRMKVKKEGEKPELLFEYKKKDTTIKIKRF